MTQHAVPRTEAGQPWRTVAVAAHLHTAVSDGYEPLATLVQAAAAEGVDAMIVTDHETLGHAFNGYSDDVLVLTGEEVTPGYHERLGAGGRLIAGSQNDHLLAFGINQSVANSLDPAENVRNVAKAGGHSFSAHPEDPEGRWTDWNVLGDGMEIWNFKSAWKRGKRKAATATYAWRNPDAVLDPPAPEVLARWDEIGRTRRFVGTCGMDNHAHNYNVDGTIRPLMPWHIGINTLLNYVVVESAAFASDPVRAVLDAFAEGHLSVVHHGYAPARGLSVQLREAGGAEHRCGDELGYSEGLALVVELPREAEIVVLADGAEQARTVSASLEHRVDQPGVWRVEVLLGGKAWIFSNPFYVRP